MLSIPPGTKMFQFPGLASTTYSFSRGSPGLTRRGCPIRRSAGKLASSKPRLIAGSYVLHRLSVPRHPPHALTSLVKNLTWYSNKDIQGDIRRRICSCRSLDSVHCTHYEVPWLPLHSTVKDLKRQPLGHTAKTVRSFTYHHHLPSVLPLHGHSTLLKIWWR